MLPSTSPCTIQIGFCLEPPICHKVNPLRPFPFTLNVQRRTPPRSSGVSTTQGGSGTEGIKAQSWRLAYRIVSYPSLTFPLCFFVSHLHLLLVLVLVLDLPFTTPHISPFYPPPLLLLLQSVESVPTRHPLDSAPHQPPHLKPNSPSTPNKIPPIPLCDTFPSLISDNYRFDACPLHTVIVIQLHPGRLPLPSRHLRPPFARASHLAAVLGIFTRLHHNPNSSTTSFRLVPN